MDAPKAPIPANPNAQDPAGHNQDQVPVGSAPGSRSHTDHSKCTCSTSTTTGPYSSGPCWYHAHSSDFLSKLDREETRIFR